MNSDMIGGLIRWAIGAGSAWVVTKGWLDQSTATMIAGALISLATAGWSVQSNKTGKVIGVK